MIPSASYLRNRARPRRCRESESGQAASAASPEPHRISRTPSAICSLWTRCPRRWIIRCCCRPTIPAAASTTSRICCSFRPPHGALSRRGPQDQPPGRGRSDHAGDGQHLPPFAGADRRTCAWMRCRSARAAAWAFAAIFRWMASTWSRSISPAPAREPHQIEVSVDGERMQLVTIGETRGGGQRPGRPRRRRRRTSRSKFAIPVKAGPRLIGVAFVQRTEARDEATLRPRMRGRGSQPAMIERDHQRSLQCQRARATRPAGAASSSAVPTDAADELPCAKRILSTLERRAYRRPVTDADLDDLMPFYTAGRAEAGFEMGIQKALERMLVSPQFLFRIERDPPGSPGSRIASAIWSWPRGFPSSSGAAFRTTSCWTWPRRAS